MESGESPGLKTQIPSPSHYRLCRIFGISEALVVPLLLRDRQGCPEVGYLLGVGSVEADGFS